MMFPCVLLLDWRLNLRRRGNVLPWLRRRLRRPKMKSLSWSTKLGGGGREEEWWCEGRW